jgi:hypothetical protein
VADVQIWSRPSGLIIRRVSGCVFRSAQPKDLADWEFMRDSLGIDTVVKLNTESEGSDKGGRALGFAVHDYAIPPIGDGPILQEIAGIFERPNMGKIEEAMEIAAAGNCLVHCTHGEDRTGLVCGIYRVRYDGWSTKEAWDEMIALGYHPEFIGLDRAWFMECSAGRGV